MLSNFIFKQDIDILLVQEVTHLGIGNIYGYTTHYNIGTSQRGTAIIARDNIELRNITKIPTGRAIAAEHKGTWIINIYAPSGAAKRGELDKFFNTGLIYLLRTET